MTVSRAMCSFQPKASYMFLCVVLFLSDDGIEISNYDFLLTLDSIGDFCYFGAEYIVQRPHQGMSMFVHSIEYFVFYIFGKLIVPTLSDIPLYIFMLP